MTATELPADWLTTWQGEMAALLEPTLDLFESAYGYPPDDNRVQSADDESRAAAARCEDAGPLPAALATFYATIARVQLPDIAHGYFIHPPDLVLDHLASHKHVRLTEQGTGIVFGSDGGGILFALDSAGQVHRSTAASWYDDFEPTEPSLKQFLERLHRTTATFAGDTRHHASAGH